MDELLDFISGMGNLFEGISSTTWLVIIIGIAVLWFGMRSRA